MFKHLRAEADRASVDLATSKGPCLDARAGDIQERFSHKLAIAPTASISIICGGTSAGIEPIPANIYTHKTLSGSFTLKNRHLVSLLEEKGLNTPDIWSKILENQGSVQFLDELTDHEKDVYKTAFELDQIWIIEHAADRTPYICQSQSVNIFLPADIAKWDLHMLQWTAWEKGLKSLYYCRSKSIQRAAFAGKMTDETTSEDKTIADIISANKYSECASCQ